MSKRNPHPATISILKGQIIVLWKINGNMRIERFYYYGTNIHESLEEKCYRYEEAKDFEKIMKPFCEYTKIIEL